MDRVVIPSTHVNAVGLVLSLREIGFKGPITCLQHKIKQDPITARFRNLCETRLITRPESERLPDQLADWYAGEQVAVLFTDERYLSAFADDGRFATVRGAGPHLDTVEHRHFFYQFITDHGLAEVPHTVPSSANPWDLFPGRFRTRVWKSWQNLERLPRGRIIEGKSDLADWREFAQSKGLGPDDWGYQAQLSEDPKDNVSVCGWHCPDVHQSIVTCRREVALGLGWVVERIPDPDGLIQVAQGLLEALDFEGPFELEFVFDADTEVYRVIELNPRFWMQHRLFQRLTDHAAVRRALGRKATTSVQEDGPRFWMQTDLAITRPLTASRFARRSVLAHPIRGSVRSLLRRRLGL